MRSLRFLYAAAFLAAIGGWTPSIVYSQTTWPALGIASLNTETVRLLGREQKVLGTVRRQQIIDLIDIKERIEDAASINCDFYIVDGGEPNAFAGIVQGRSIVAVNLPMLSLLGDDAHAWAALFGHEIAHLTLAHTSTNQSRRQGLTALGVIAGIVLGAFGVPGGGTLADLGTTLVDRSFTRDQERAADRVGMEFMVAAGFAPHGTIALQDKLLSFGRSMPIPFLSTHPSGEERIEAMRQLAATFPTRMVRPLELPAASRFPPTSQVKGEADSIAILAVSRVADLYQKGHEAYANGNYAEAIRLWTPIANDGFSEAQNNLGVIHEKGLGVPSDYGKAAAWYEKAAKQNRPQAQNNLGVLYEKGLGVSQDVNLAAQWYRRSAEQGHAVAQNNLGVLYGTGRGTPVDLVEAYVWFGLAAARGSEHASKNLPFVESKLTAEQLASARTRIKSWRPKREPVVATGNVR
jgi:Zn-dependent protease with chaperone function